MFKKILAISIVMVTALCFTACPNGTGSPSVEEIIEKAVQAMEDVETYQFELDMSMDMASEAEGETYEEAIAMNYEGTFDIGNQEMMLDMYVSVAMFAEGTEMSGVMYIIDGMAYVMSEDPEAGPVWSKSEAPAEFWDEMNQIESQLEMLKAVHAEIIGSEKIRGVDCYVLSFTPDIGQLLQLAIEQSLLTEEELALLDMDEQEELYRDAFKGYSIKQWIAQDTYYITKAEISIAMEVTSEAMGYTEEGILTMDITMDLLAYDYNQPVSIVLPAGAEEAIEELE